MPYFGLININWAGLATVQRPLNPSPIPGEIIVTLLIALGIPLAVALGALCLYLASPHQKLLPHRALPVPLIAAGTVLLLASFALLRTYFSPAIAVFILLTTLMLLWSLPPLLIAWLRHGP